ncbi:MAG: hypothetical protein HWN71_03510 [Desulfobacterales bacterium]|nr:hypothetical protein [Desulfobacterales bacterium]
MREKRRLERFQLEIPAAIEFLTSDREKRLLNLLTSDICSGGAYFHTTQPLPEGTKVKMDLVLPLDRLKKANDEHKQVYIKVAGTVLRSESGGMAICFDEDYEIMGAAHTRLGGDK